jgi:hypothetical protein
MTREVIVAFGPTRRYQFYVHEGDLAGATDDQARRWLDDQWDALECEPASPTGKILLLDKMLCVARGGGEDRFADKGAWAQQFVRSVARLLERPVVLVDVAESRVG